MTGISEERWDRDLNNNPGQADPGRDYWFRLVWPWMRLKYESYLLGGYDFRGIRGVRVPRRASLTEIEALMRAHPEAIERWLAKILPTDSLDHVLFRLALLRAPPGTDHPFAAFIEARRQEK